MCTWLFATTHRCMTRGTLLPAVQCAVDALPCRTSAKCCTLAACCVKSVRDYVQALHVRALHVSCQKQNWKKVKIVQDISEVLRTRAWHYEKNEAAMLLRALARCGWHPGLPAVTAVVKKVSFPTNVTKRQPHGAHCAHLSPAPPRL